MITLILIGLVGGLITGVSPCILPMLPVIFIAGADTAQIKDSEKSERGSDDTTGAGSAAGAGSTTAKHKKTRNLRPYAVIAGLVVSFTFFTLLGSLLVNALNLPDNILKVVGLVVLTLVGLGLIFPAIERQLERLFSWVPQRQRGSDRGAFVLGLGLGLLYVPCAGPVLAAITIAGATGHIGISTVALTLSFAIGATAPLLVFALAGRGVSERVKAFRTRAKGLRIAAGVIMIVLAVALAYDLPAAVQRLVPNYTSGLQHKVEDNPALRPQLAKLTDGGNSKLGNCPSGAKTLRNDCGEAQPIEATGWLNTPGDKGIDLQSLRGKVVLLDFWTYSCANCQRSVPHVEGWYKTYHDAGLEVIGVHTPEFSFERDLGNIKDGANRLNITYPIAVDNNYGTWTNYRNRYWPSAFLIDAKGQVRYLHLGEGNYDRTESMIRQLLTQKLLTDANPNQKLPKPSDVKESNLVADRTPETYLNYTKLGSNFASEKIGPDNPKAYHFPKSQKRDTVALDGTWTIGAEQSTAGENARLALEYRASKVYIVLGGEGTVTYKDGSQTKTIQVSGPPRLYTLISGNSEQSGRLALSVSPQIQAYSFTFG
ncbi:MAG TPA: cytochrome c biogenesis protein DipZ [Mycobacteriales bacterium]|nr:cytochrome c biogenesis protein DipZ [Mycobacteriales bacterium]